MHSAFCHLTNVHAMGATKNIKSPFCYVTRKDLDRLMPHSNGKDLTFYFIK